MKIKFQTENQTFYGEFNNTQTAKEITRHLPIESTISLWGDEIYFDLGFKASAHNATMDVDIGDIAYWSQGKCLCVFFGPTPVSQNKKPVPASPVVIIGKTNTAAQELKKIDLGEKIILTREE